MILLDTDTCFEILRGNQNFKERRIENDMPVASVFKLCTYTPN